MMNKTTWIGVAGILLGLNLAQAQADDTTKPNFYSCQGQNTSLTLAIGSGAEAGTGITSTVMVLNLGNNHYAAQDSDITSESTIFGTAMEIVTSFMPDVEVNHASVVIPDINLSLQNNQAMFKSQLILTKTATPFTGTPPEGVINKSRYIDLICNASVVS